MTARASRRGAERPGSLSLLIAGVIVIGAGSARAQAPAPAPPAAAPGAPAVEGAVGQAPIAAGDVATARERALNEAFRQLVEAAFAGLVAENGGATSPALASLRAGWLQRPKRLVRSYRVLEQSEDGGMLRVRVTAELDEVVHAAGVRSQPGRGQPGRRPGRAAGAGGGRARGGHGPGRRARRPRASAPSCRPAAPATRRRCGRWPRAPGGRWRWSPVAPPARARCAAPASRRWSAQLGVRLVSADAGAGAERTASARGFQIQEADARTACFARAARELLPALLPEVGGGRAGTAGDLRVVTLDLDINEPAVISPVLRALRKIGGATSTEVRRVVVGRVEVRVSSRLTAAALMAGLTRELASLATVTRSGIRPGPPRRRPDPPAAGDLAPRRRRARAAGPAGAPMTCP